MAARVSVNDWVTLCDQQKLKRLCDEHSQIEYNKKHEGIGGTSRRVSFICKSPPRYIGVKVMTSTVKIPLRAIKSTLGGGSPYNNGRYRGMSTRQNTHYNRRPPRVENVCPDDEEPDGLPLLKPSTGRYPKNCNVKTC